MLQTDSTLILIVKHLFILLRICALQHTSALSWPCVPNMSKYLLLWFKGKEQIDRPGWAIKYGRTAGDARWHEISQEEASGVSDDDREGMKSEDKRRVKKKKHVWLVTSVGCTLWIVFTWLQQCIYFLTLKIWFQTQQMWCILGKNILYLPPTSAWKGPVCKDFQSLF